MTEMAADGIAHAHAGFCFPPPRASGIMVTMDRMIGAQAIDPRRLELVSLLEGVTAANPAALRALYERTSAKPYGICLRVLGDEAEAQDTLQDVYVTVWRNAGRFDATKASPITWLAVLARNRAIDRLRTRRAPAEDLDQAAEVVDDSPSALDVIEREEDATRLAHCLDELEQRARTMIRAAFFDGATYAELAEREAVPLGTMKSWIRRGLARLRGCLEQ